LEPFKDFDVGCGSCAPKLNTVGSYGFENCFVEKYSYFVSGEELRLPSKKPVQFGQCAAKLFPLGENVFMPGESSIQVKPEVFDRGKDGEKHHGHSVLNPSFVAESRVGSR
jgi:hypothetical protein